MRRDNIRWLVVACFIITFAATLAGCGGTAATPSMRFSAPTDGATVKGPKVKLEVAVTNWKLVPAGGALVEGEGHLHFFIEVPVESVAVGQAIPPTESNPAYVHAGKDPLMSRELQLSPGKHTITAVMGNASHLALASPAPQSITITVE
jgi:hypothetical protein